MTLYLSGPITGNPNFTELFEKAEARLTKMGYKVINPAKLPAALPVNDMCYEDILDVCLNLLEKADAMCLLPGWEKSRGANRELGYALGTDTLVWVADLEEAEDKFVLMPFGGVK